MHKKKKGGEVKKPSSREAYSLFILSHLARKNRYPHRSAEYQNINYKDNKN